MNKFLSVLFISIIVISCNDENKKNETTDESNSNNNIILDKEARLASGKANDFVAFIRNDVFQFLENTYKVDMTKNVFAGHTLVVYWLVICL